MTCTVRDHVSPTTAGTPGSTAPGPPTSSPARGSRTSRARGSRTAGRTPRACARRGRERSRSTHRAPTARTLVLGRPERREWGRARHLLFDSRELSPAKTRSASGSGLSTRGFHLTGDPGSVGRRKLPPVENRVPAGMSTHGSRGVPDHAVHVRLRALKSLSRTRVERRVFFSPRRPPVVASRLTVPGMTRTRGLARRLPRGIPDKCGGDGLSKSCPGSSRL